MKKSLIIFLKAPKPGKVKTRLAATLGEKPASDFYKICVEHTISESLELKKEIDINIFYSDENDEVEIKNWLGDDFIFHPQHGGNLGDKINNAFENVFSNGSNSAVIIGTDLPDINSELIAGAFNSLKFAEIVIGPSYDGGYYLLGQKKNHPEIFKKINWSTSSVFQTTIEKIVRNNLSFYKMKKLKDIDTENDLRDWYGTASIKNPVRLFLVKYFK